MNCTQCGTGISAGVSFCPNCGTRVATPVPAALAPRPAASLSVAAPPRSEKSKVAAGVMQILLGPFGAGRFYTGHTGIAIAQIAATWLTCGVGVLWPIIDGLLMLMGKVNDSDGRPLRD